MGQGVPVLLGLVGRIICVHADSNASCIINESLTVGPAGVPGRAGDVGAGGGWSIVTPLGRSTCGGRTSMWRMLRARMLSPPRHADKLPGGSEEWYRRFERELFRHVLIARINALVTRFETRSRPPRVVSEEEPHVLLFGLRRP